MPPPLPSPPLPPQINTVNSPARHTGDAHHSLVALTLTEGSLVEAIPPLLHGVGGDLAQGVHNVLLPMPRLWILHHEQCHPSFNIRISQNSKQRLCCG